jgi:hypothetical protein
MQAAKPAAAKPGAVSTYNEALDDESDSGAKQPLPEMALAGKAGASSKTMAKIAKDQLAAAAAAAAAENALEPGMKKAPILVRMGLSSCLLHTCRPFLHVQPPFRGNEPPPPYAP